MDGWEFFRNAVAVIGGLSGLIATLICFIFKSSIHQLDKDNNANTAKIDALNSSVNVDVRGLRDSNHDIRNRLSGDYMQRPEIERRFSDMDGKTSTKFERMEEKIDTWRTESSEKLDSIRAEFADKLDRLFEELRKKH